MSIVQNELQELYEKYTDFDFIGYHNKISKSNTNNKYSKGLGFVAGLFELSYVYEITVSNSDIGKEVKKIENGYDYKYYFDENDRIILSEKYLEDYSGEKKLKYLNFYFFNDNTCELIHIDVKKDLIYLVAKAFYDEFDRIARYIQVELSSYNKDKHNRYEEHLFRYENEITYITQTVFWGKNENIRSTYMMIKENVLYYLNKDGTVRGFYPIRFKIVDGKKVYVPLPKKVPVFKIIKDNMINILSKWNDIDKSVIWVLCENADLVMQYTTLTEECEQKWNIAFYDTDEEEIFTNKDHVQVLEDLLFNSGCEVNDLFGEENYFTDKMVKIVKELRKEGYIPDSTAVIISDLEISETTFNIAQKINKKETIKGFYNF